MNLRLFRPSDTEQIAQLFHDTIRSINKKDYTLKQVKAWAPDDIFFRNWEIKCSEKFTLVAESQEIITGFAQLENDGHIDCFYCHKNFQHQGVGKALYTGIENEAKKRNVSRMTVEASITAKPFFERMGFSLIREQSVEVRGENLKNFKMEKVI